MLITFSLTLAWCDRIFFLLRCSNQGAASREAPETEICMARAKMMDAAADTIESAADEGVSTMKETMNKASKGLERFTAFHKETIEALVASAGAATKGAEKMQGEFAAFAKSAAEELVATSKAMMSAKSAQDAFELQSAYVKSSLEATMAEMTKMNEMWMGAMRDALEPMQARAKAFMSMVQVA